MKSPQKQLDGFIAKYSPEIAALARELFAKLRTMMPQATILVYDNYNALAIGFAPNEKTSTAIFSLALYPRWINFFFLQGATLPDPDHILCGSGKQVRHVLLESPADLDRVELRRLIDLALDCAKVPIEPDNQPQIIIKSISENQRPRRPTKKK